MTNYFIHKFRGKSPIEIVVIIIFGAIAITGFAFLFGYIIMLLWNWLMPEIFGLGTLTFWQTVGLVLLLKLTLGGWGSGGSSSKSSKDRDEDGKKKSRTEFSKWKYYDKFWKEEGDEQYKKFVERQSVPTVENDPDPKKE
jgi:hypothetical protein